MRLIVFLLLLFSSTAFAFQGMGPGPGVKGYASVADYTPAQVQFRFGTASTAGNNVKVMIYNSSNTLLCTSSPLAKSGGNTVTGSISGCSALTPGNTYKVAYVGDGYISPSLGTSPTWQINTASSSGSYTTPPSTLPSGDNVAWGEIAVRVDNASGTRLLGDSDFSNNTNVSNSGVGANTLAWTAGGYVCVTL